MMWEPYDEPDFFDLSDDDRDNIFAKPCKSCFGRGKARKRPPPIFSLKLPKVVEKVRLEVHPTL